MATSSSPGEKSFRAAVALQAIEAKPSCGEIKPSEPRWAMGTNWGDVPGDRNISTEGRARGDNDAQCALAMQYWRRRCEGAPDCLSTCGVSRVLMKIEKACAGISVRPKVLARATCEVPEK
jgi:hypothetical protein